MNMRSLPTARGRLLRDRAAAILINTVGIGIVGLVLLILSYLLSAVLPLSQALTLGAAVPLAEEVAPLPRRHHGPDADGMVRVSDVRSGALWELEASGTYRCSRDASFRALPAPVAAPVRAVDLAENGDVLLVLDARGALWRFTQLASQACGLSYMGPAYVQPFVADVLLSERARPVVVLLDSVTARLRVLLSTTGETLYDGVLPDAQRLNGLSMADDGSALQGAVGGQRWLWSVSNPYPEASWRGLWGRVWYGGYERPAHVWHPGGEGIGALSKYGLTPLLWGTFKAALYGMLIAVPVAIGAAIYTGYFLPQRLRNRVKPAIELLEAFPTVVLGFVAGLWLAPLLSDYLLFLIIVPLVLIVLPLLLAASHAIAQRLSSRFRRRPPRIAILVAAYLITCVGIFWWVPSLEWSLFGGTLGDFLLEIGDLHYEQRNALLVGLAMGFALVPTLFSIVEDAIFAVPRSLSDASLALGSTRWQSLSHVVLPAASPAILSALLIALARGLGETMIVLLATGNTPIMEAGPFSGLRSLSASLAAELPEAAVGGIQFRVLFLASLVLFGLTFALNTVAELFRQRLRYRYAGR